MITAALKTAGHRVGMYISPFVTCFNERISVNRGNIPNDTLAELTTEVKAHVDAMVAEGRNHPTEFEIITAVALTHFSRERCDYVVLEVGMGGRLDATNAIENPILSIITSISFDHMQYLGDTIAKIAYEKCGIIKQNSRVVCYPAQPREALEVIEQTCAERSAALTIAHMPQNVRLSIGGNSIDYPNFPNIRTALAGDYQAYNAATAICALDILRQEMNVKLMPDDIYAGLALAAWPGRFEVIAQNPLVIIDGGHNVSAAQELEMSIRQLIPEKRLTIVMGMLADKEYRQCIELLAPLTHHFIATTVQSPRAADAVDIAACAVSAPVVSIYPNPQDAVNMAVESAEYGDAVAIIGSLFLVADVRDGLIERFGNTSS